jgi:hypothetical protein
MAGEGELVCEEGVACQFVDRVVPAHVLAHRGGRLLRVGKVGSVEDGGGVEAAGAVEELLLCA